MAGISIRVIILILLLVVAISTALIAFLPIYKAAVTSLDESVDIMQRETSLRLRNDLQNFFTAPMQGISSIGSVSKFGLLDPFNSTSLVAPVADYAWRFKLPAYVGNENGAFVYCSPSTSVATGLRCTLYVDQFPAGAPRLAVGWAVDNQSFALLYVVSTANASYNPRARPWYSASFRSQSWSSLYVEFGGGATDATAGTPLLSQSTGRIGGVFAADVRTDNLLAYLSKTTVGKTGEVLLVERSTRNVLGGNWNESSFVEINASLGLWRMATFDDYRNVLLHRTLSALGVNNIFNATLPYSAAFGSGLDRVRVSLESIKDSYGLDLVMMLMLPEKDFTEQLQMKVRSSAGAVVGAVLGITLIALVLVYWLFQPLKRVESRMEAAASLDDDEEDDKNSFLSEIQTIQTAYSKMQKQLQKVKSYLPQSVRARFDENDDFTDTESMLPISPTEGGPSEKSNRQSANERSTHQGASTAVTRQKDSDTKSVRSSRSSRHLAAAAGLNIATGMTLRKVTVLVFNLRGFHNAIKNGIESATTWQQGVLGLVERLAAAQKGIIDNFQGDHVFVTFNACNNVPTHAARAAHTALQIVSALEKEKSAQFNGCSIGIAMGEALTGNCGTPNLKRFNISGAVFNQAMVLERLCKQCNVPTLVTPPLATQIEHEFFTEAVEIVALPGTGRLSVLSTLLGAKSGASDEWLYEIERNNAADKSASANIAWSKFASGDITAATEVLKTVTTQSASIAKLTRIMAEYQDPEKYAAEEMNRFYTNAFLQVQTAPAPSASSSS
jgi:class 3 adenylate cyclase